MRRLLSTLAPALALLGVLATGDSAAGQAAEPVGLGPTLSAIKARHVVRIGYREASLPFSFLDRSGRPIGYSLDLCAAIVGEIGRQVDQDDLAIAYVKVTAADRIASVVDGRIDLECGSTTANAERSRSVAFSPTIFVAGTRLMVGAASRSGTIRDLAGRRVVVTKGTTNERRSTRPTPSWGSG